MLLTLGDPQRVGYILDALRITQDDFQESKRADQVSKVVKYLVQHPDPAFFIRKALGSKQVDRVDFMDEYIEIHEDLDRFKKDLTETEEKLSVYDPEDINDIDMTVYQPLKEKRDFLESYINSLQQELRIYEK